MPIYEYKCENGHVFEVIQKMSDQPLHECEECGAPASRVLTPPAIHFKGSGFHNTDYGTRKSGSNGGSSEGGSDSSSSSKSESGKSETKSDSKPAASAAD
jgi:putative FmdB family regulatory protein